jgi:ribosome recycling factor
MIKVPALTQERRQNLIKLVAQYGEDNKIALRNIRHDILKDIKKQFDEKLISEDQKKLFEKECDEITKQYTTKIDQLVKIKSEEIMKI